MADTPDDQCQFRFVGGGVLLEGQHFPFYNRALWKLQRWWRAGSQAECRVFAWVGGKKTEARVRRSRHQVYAACERAIDTDDQGRPIVPGPQAALADVEALIAKLRQRLDLPEPPQLLQPDPPLSSGGSGRRSSTEG